MCSSTFFAVLYVVGLQALDSFNPSCTEKLVAETMQETPQNRPWLETQVCIHASLARRGHVGL
jgi:hypothetical protein